MANVRWQGGAAAVAQVTTYAFAGTWEADDVVRVVIGAKKYDFTGGSTTITTAIDNIVTAWNALDSSDYPEFAEITASRSSTSLVLTGDTAGKPFTATLTPLEANLGAADAQTIEGAGTATTGTNSTAATGPNHWNDARNWSGGAVPVNSDSVFLEHSTSDIKYGLDQSAVTLTALNIASSFTGTIGLPETNADATEYHEYRSQYLAIGATTVTIGAGPGRGSPRLRLDTGSVQTTLIVRNTASSLDADVPALVWKGTHASNAVNLFRGDMGIGTFDSDAATVATLRVGLVTSEATDASLVCGPNVTLTTLNQSGGSVELNSGLTTVTKTAGSLVLGTGNVTTITNDGGLVVYKGTGTITTLNLGTGGAIDFSQDMRSRTVTDANLYAGSSVADPFATVTWTNPVRLVRCSLAEVDVDVGKHRTYAISS